MDQTVENLDWIAARIAAHPPVAFKRLAKTVQGYVQAYNSSQLRSATAVFDPGGEAYFSVGMRLHGFDREWVGFRLQGPGIEILRGAGVEAVGAPLLTATGHVRFKVDHDHLTEWQFLGKALDPLFFP